MLKLPHTLFGNAELSSDLIERCTLLRQASLMNNSPFAGRKLVQSLGQTARSSGTIARPDYNLFGISPRIGKQILPILVAVVTDRCV